MRRGRGRVRAADHTGQQRRVHLRPGTEPLAAVRAGRRLHVRALSRAARAVGRQGFRSARRNQPGRPLPSRRCDAGLHAAWRRGKARARRRRERPRVSHRLLARPARRRSGSRSRRARGELVHLGRPPAACRRAAGATPPGVRSHQRIQRRHPPAHGRHRRGEVPAAHARAGRDDAEGAAGHRPALLRGRLARDPLPEARTAHPARNPRLRVPDGLCVPLVHGFQIRP